MLTREGLVEIGDALSQKYLAALERIKELEAELQQTKDMLALARNENLIFGPKGKIP